MHTKLIDVLFLSIDKYHRILQMILGKYMELPYLSMYWYIFIIIMKYSNILHFKHAEIHFYLTRQLHKNSNAITNHLSKC